MVVLSALHNRAYKVALRFHDFELCKWMLIRINLWLRNAVNDKGLTEYDGV